MRIYGMGSEAFAFSALDGVTTSLVRVWHIEDILHWSLQIETTGALTATILLEADNRYTPDPSLHNTPANAGAWIDITARVTPALVNPAAASKQLVVPTVILACRALRCTLTRTGNTGTGFMALVGKGL